MSIQRFWALAVSAVLVASCGFFPNPPAAPTPAPVPPTQTVTPFVPLPPTETLVPSPTPTITPTPVEPWENFPGPSEPSSTEIPRPIRELVGQDRVNIMVLGTDDALGRRGMNSDVMLLVSIDGEEGTVSMISFPRDLFVYIPGEKMNRINAAFARGGRDLLASTMLFNFGIEIDYYARVNFASFVDAVDTLGGIDVEVESYLYDMCGGTWYTFQGGRTYHMDGETALCYARMRRNSGGDFGRQVRAQEVILAIFRKVLSLEGLTRLPELYGEFSQIVETDMGLGDMLPLMPTAADVAQDPLRIERYTFAGMVNSWTTPIGSYVLLPDKEAVQAMLEEALD